MTKSNMQDRCPRSMHVHRAGEGIAPGPDGISTAPFLVQMLLSSHVEGEMTAMRVFVPPDAATHWHSHPRGQLLFVLDGVGFVQREGGSRVDVRTGDAIWFAADEPHRHGAAPTSPFSYVSIQSVKDGTAVRWLGSAEGGSVAT